jgi:AcrR family transcriptional regulator
VPEPRRLAATSSARRERADRILDAATDLLRRHGYRRVTIDEVAAAAGVGKGTLYLHWKTREALFWAALQRETVRLLDAVLAELAAAPRLALPQGLMRAIYLEISARPLVLALMLSDAEILGALATDPGVASAQRELAGNPNYLVQLADTGLLRAGLTPETAGHVLTSVMRGFFAAADDGLPLDVRADLVAEVLRRSLETDGEPAAQAVAALHVRVVALLSGLVDALRRQLEAAY